MRFTIKTYGCQMNVYDSERIAEMLTAAGLESATDGLGDVLLLNTCSVREKPREKVISAIKQAKAGNPAIKVVVTGCVAQLEGDSLLAEGADLVMGPDWYDSLAETLFSMDATADYQAVYDGFITDNPTFLEADPRATGVSAFLPIQKGCGNFCTYCVVPMARGPERSRPQDDILHEVKRFVSKGATEIFLLGQNVNSYKGEGGISGLLRSVSAVPGVERVRFTTSHPKDLSGDLIEVMATVPQVMPWLHLPVQSGSNAILRLMGRGYSREGYLELVQRVKEAVPHIALTTDIIVGFPSESEADFHDTVDLVRQVGYEGMFSFRYSERPGTAAMKLPGSVPPTDRARRLSELQALHEASLGGLMQKYVGQTLPVLVEGVSARSEVEARGRIGQNHVVNFSILPGTDPVALTGSIVMVTIDEVRTHTLHGAQR